MHRPQQLSLQLKGMERLLADPVSDRPCDDGRCAPPGSPGRCVAIRRPRGNGPPVSAAILRIHP